MLVLYTYSPFLVRGMHIILLCVHVAIYTCGKYNNPAHYSTLNIYTAATELKIRHTRLYIPPTVQSDIVME